MTKATVSFSGQLLKWYQSNARDLPWRRTKDPYYIWLSEIMLQQTTVNAVIPYYERWIKRFPDIRSLARAPLQTVLKEWQGMGYYSRAKNLHKAAKIVCREFSGFLPSVPETLRRLPGFGPYTAAAVSSIAFGLPTPLIDANVRRVMMRYLGIEGPALPKHDEKILNVLERIMPAQKMSSFNQGLMELGALVCKSRNPVCNRCPVHEGCAAYERGMQEIIPEPKKVKLKEVTAVIAVIIRDGHVLIQKRPPKGLFADLWEFPGGKIQEGETLVQALKREIKEEVGIEILDLKKFMHLTHFYTQFRARLHVWTCRTEQPVHNSSTRKWISLKQLSRYPMPSGSAKIVDRIYKENIS